MKQLARSHRLFGALMLAACATSPPASREPSSSEAAEAPHLSGDESPAPDDAGPSIRRDADVGLADTDPTEAGAHLKLSLPDGVNELPLEGYNPAAFVTPRRSDEPPWPLIVVLHGNFDRPEWQCETWSKEGRSKGWLLCPRGYPRPEADAELDRWTYKGRTKLAGEIERGAATLEERFPELLRRDGATLIGFSLGAIMAPHLAGMEVLPFKHLVLAEGGYQVTAEIARRAARRGVERVVYVCGERTACRTQAKGLRNVWKRAGVRCETVVMPGVGHGYNEDFDPIARQTFELLEGD